MLAAGPAGVVPIDAFRATPEEAYTSLSDYMNNVFNQTDIPGNGRGVPRTSLTYADLSRLVHETEPLIYTNMATELHYINKSTLPLFITDKIRHQTDVDTSQPIMATQVPAWGTARQMRFTSKRIRSESHRYGLMAELEADFKNTQEGRIKLNKIIRTFASASLETMSSLAINSLRTGGERHSGNGLLQQTRDHATYHAMLRDQTDNFGCVNKEVMGLDRLVGKVKAEMKRCFSHNVDTIYMPHGKADALHQSGNPMYYKYSDAGDQGPKRMHANDPMSFRTCKGVPIMDAPIPLSARDRSKVTIANEEDPMGRNVTIGEFAMCKRYQGLRAPEWDLISATDNGFVTVAAKDLLLNSGRFVYRRKGELLGWGGLLGHLDGTNAEYNQDGGWMDMRPNPVGGILNTSRLLGSRMVAGAAQEAYDIQAPADGIYLDVRTILDVKRNGDGAGGGANFMKDDPFFVSGVPVIERRGGHGYLNGVTLFDQYMVTDPDAVNVRHLIDPKLLFRKTTPIESMDWMCDIADVADPLDIIDRLGFDAARGDAMSIAMRRYIIGGETVHFAVAANQVIGGGGGRRFFQDDTAGYALMDTSAKAIRMRMRILDSLGLPSWDPAAGAGAGVVTPGEISALYVAGGIPSRLMGGLNAPDILNNAAGVEAAALLYDGIVTRCNVIIAYFNTIKFRRAMGDFSLPTPLDIEPMQIVNHMGRLTEHTPCYRHALSDDPDSVDWLSVFSIMATRPLCTYRMQDVLVLAGGSGLGYTAHSPNSIELAQNITQGAWGIEWRAWIAVHISDWTRVVNILNAVYNGIMHGCNATVVDARYRAEYRRDRFIPLNEHDPSIFPIIVPASFNPRYKYIHLAGRSHLSSENDAADYPGADFAMVYFGFNTIINPREDPSSYDNSPVSPLCYRSTIRYMGPVGPITITGATHHGPYEGVGCENIRRLGDRVIEPELLATP